MALWYGDADVAREMIGVVTGEIQTLYTGTDNAAVQARKLYHAEREKPFKGEPYERMMAYVYQGLLDYAHVDYSNAAASFRQAILQDAFADEQQNRCDFEVAEYLLARSMLRDRGDPALIKEAMQRAAELSSLHGTHMPPLRAEENVLLFLEIGPAPFKVAQGESNELLVIGRRGSDGMHAVVTVDDGLSLTTRETSNLAFQAMTRGGRQFDFILAGQAYTKRTTEQGALTVNQIGTAISFVVPYVGAPLQAASLIAKAIGMGMEPRADTRYWETLPDSIHLVSMRLSPGSHVVRIRFYNHFGEPMTDQDHIHNIDVQHRGDTLVWVSSEDRWPMRPLNVREHAPKQLHSSRARPTEFRTSPTVTAPSAFL